MKAKWLGAAGVVMLLAAGQAGAAIYFNDGGYHVIDYVINDLVYVDYDKPDAGTQIEVVSGGWIRDNIDAHGTSRVIINGGNVDRIVTSLSDVGIVVYSGVVGGISAGPNSELEIHGGEITEGFGTGGLATITGGVMGNITAGGTNAHITMTGGTVLDTIGAISDGLITLVGNNFQVNGHSVGYGDFASTWGTPGIDPWGLPPHTQITGTITGVLDSGDSINSNFLLEYQGDIAFIPEPATFVLLLVGASLIKNRNHN